MRHSTTALALVAPFVLLGFIDVLAVQPRRAEEQAASSQASALRATLLRTRSLGTEVAPLAPIAQRGFELRTASDDLTTETGEAITSLLGSPAVGGVTGLTLEAGEPVRADESKLDPRMALFHTPLWYTPLTVRFDARYAQIGRFFWNLRTLPTTFELRAVEMTPAAEPSLMRTTVTLLVFQRADSVPPAAPQVALVDLDVTSAPNWYRDPFAEAAVAVKEVSPAVQVQEEPVVRTILYSSQSRAALIDGRIVRPGDRLGAGSVRDIEPDSVVFVSDSGRVTRLKMEPSKVRATKR